MLDVSTTHPFETCAAFAVRLIGRLAAGDLSGAESLIDANDTGRPFAESFPPPDGFTYCHPDEVRNWQMLVVGADRQGLRCDFDLPFADAEYRDRPMVVRFHMRRKGDQLEVRLLGVVPS